MRGDNYRVLKSKTSEIKTGTSHNLTLHDEFLMIILKRGMTTKTTTLTRINSFRYLVFMGNCNGVIGYGKGKGANFELAYHDAIVNCKKNLIAIPLDLQLTLPQKLQASFNGMKMTLFPQHSCNAWGNPVFATMLMLTGVVHCRFKLVHRNLNPYALIFAYFKMITQNLTPRQLCERTGRKIYS